MPIQPPANTSPSPDKDTKKAQDYTADGEVDDRVLKIQWLGITYGTNDKAHGAAIFISILLVVVLVMLGVIGGLVALFKPEAGPFDGVFSIVGPLLSFVIGTAIGRTGFLGRPD